LRSGVPNKTTVARLKSSILSPQLPPKIFWDCLRHASESNQSQCVHKCVTH